MNPIIIVALVFGVAGWFIHLVFIAFAIANKGKIEINYNYYKEMYPELIIMIFIFILTIYAITIV